MASVIPKTSIRSFLLLPGVILLLLLLVFETSVAQKDTAQVHRFMDSALVAQSSDMSKAILLSKEAVSLSQSIGYRSGEIDAHVQLIAIYMSAGLIDSADHVADNLYDLIRGSNHLSGNHHYYLTKATIEGYGGDFVKAKALMDTCLSWCDHPGGDSLRMMTLNNFGGILFSRGDHETALKNYQEALELTRRYGDRILECNILINISQLTHALGDTRGAIDLARKGLALAEEIGDEGRLVQGYISLGSLYGWVDAMDSSEICLQKGLEYAEKIGDIRSVAVASANLATLYSSRGDCGPSIPHFERAVAILSEISEFEALPAMERMAEAYACSDQHEKAYVLQLEVNRIKDSLVSLRNDEQFAELAAKYEVAEAKLVNDSLHLENVTLEERAEQETLKAGRRRWIIITMLLGLVLVLTVVILLMRANRTKERSNQALKTLHKEKNQIISMVAHDLANPLVNIQMSAASMKIISDNLEASQEKTLDHIVESTSNLSEMIRKILDADAMESRFLNPALSRVNVEALFEDAIAVYAPLIRKKNISVFKPEPTQTTYAKADGYYLSQIVQNLLSNALKFSDTGSEITLRAERTGQKIHISITDQGPGIAKQDLPHIYEKYVTLSHRPESGEKSTGLGLAIVKKFTDAMGGRVWCESTVDVGTSFFVELEAFSPEI